MTRHKRRFEGTSSKSRSSLQARLGLGVAIWDNKNEAAPSGGLGGFIVPRGNVADVVKFTRDKGEKTTFATAAAPGRLMGNLFKEIMELKCVEAA